ncbi:7-cyano-7-deazaguanine synthase [Pseudomonas aeruginosa]
MRRGIHHEPEEAVILLSGGLDSATVVADGQGQTATPAYTMSFDYGQRHRAELRAPSAWPAVGRDRAQGDRARPQWHGRLGIDRREHRGASSRPAKVCQVTYVPARNTVFLLARPGLGRGPDARDIFIGVNAVDYSGYPDCRPEFVEAFERMANLATKAGVEGNGFRIQAPLQYLSKAQIIQAGVARGVDYGLTVSCYQADEQGRACGKCDSLPAACGWLRGGWYFRPDAIFLKKFTRGVVFTLEISIIRLALGR